MTPSLGGQNDRRSRSEQDDIEDEQTVREIVAEALARDVSEVKLEIAS